MKVWGYTSITEHYLPTNQPKHLRFLDDRVQASTPLLIAASCGATSVGRGGRGCSHPTPNPHSPLPWRYVHPLLTWSSHPSPLTSHTPTITHLVHPVLLYTKLASKALGSIGLGLMFGELGLVLPSNGTLGEGKGGEERGGEGRRGQGRGGEGRGCWCPPSMSVAFTQWQSAPPGPLCPSPHRTCPRSPWSDLAGTHVAPA